MKSRKSKPHSFKKPIKLIPIAREPRGEGEGGEREKKNKIKDLIIKKASGLSSGGLITSLGLKDRKTPQLKAVRE